MTKLKTILFLLLAFPALVLGQTQHDRLQVTQIVNRTGPTITGGTPSVSTSNVFVTGNNSATNVTNFINGTPWLIINVICGDTNTTFQNNPNIVMQSGNNFTCTQGAGLEFVMDAGSIWHQVGGTGAGSGATPQPPNGALQMTNGSALASSSIVDNGNVNISEPTTVNNILTVTGNSTLASATIGGTGLAGSGSGTATLPANTGTVSELNLAQTWTANQTLNHASQLRFLSSNGTNYAGFVGGASTSNLVWLFPTTDSTGTQCLSSNGSLQLAWSNCSAGTGTPGGSNTHVQYNNAGTFGGSADLEWNNGAATLTIGNGGGAVGILKLENGIIGQSVNLQVLGTTSGTYNFNIPAAAGTAGQPLLSGGGGSNVQTYGTLGYGGGGTGSTSFTTNQLVSSGASALSSLAGTTTGTNPILKLQPSSASNTALTLDTAASPTADILDININTVKTSFFDSSAFLHTPQTTYTGSGPLTLSGNEGTCPAPATSQDIICLGDSAAHVGKISNNGVTFKTITDWINDNPPAHGVALVGAVFPQLNSVTPGTTGLPLVAQGISADPIYVILGVSGGGTGVGTLTAHGVLLGEGTSAIAASAAGTSGQPFTSGGASTDGAYAALNLAGGSSIVTGILPVGNGGTGASSLANANIVTVSGAFTPGNCIKSSATTVAIDAGSPCGSGGSVALSGITNATASNTLTNGVNPQTWNWALTGSTTAFKFGETSAATSTNNILVQVTTLSASTAIPFQVDNNGNGWQFSSTGQLQRVGTASLAIPGTAHGVVVSEGNSTAIATTAAGTSGQLLTSGGASADPTYTFPSTTVNGATCTIASTCTVTLDVIGNPVANASFTFPAIEGLTVAGTQPASVSGAGTAAGTLVTITTPQGGNSTAGTGGTGGDYTINLGAAGSTAGGQPNAAARGGIFTIKGQAFTGGGTGTAIPNRLNFDMSGLASNGTGWGGSNTFPATGSTSGGAAIFSRNTDSTVGNTINRFSPGVGMMAHMQINGVDTEQYASMVLFPGDPSASSMVINNGNNPHITWLFEIPSNGFSPTYHFCFMQGGPCISTTNGGGGVGSNGYFWSAGAGSIFGNDPSGTLGQGGVTIWPAQPGNGAVGLQFQGRGSAGTIAGFGDDDLKNSNGSWVFGNLMNNSSGGNIADGTWVKLGTANSVTPMLTTDTGPNIVIGVVIVPGGGNCANATKCYVAYTGNLNGVVKMDSGTCNIGDALIASTVTNNGQVKCQARGSATFGTVYGYAASAQATPGNTVDVVIRMH